MKKGLLFFLLLSVALFLCTVRADDSLSIFSAEIRENSTPPRASQSHSAVPLQSLPSSQDSNLYINDNDFRPGAVETSPESAVPLQSLSSSQDSNLYSNDSDFRPGAVETPPEKGWMIYVGGFGGYYNADFQNGANYFAVGGPAPGNQVFNNDAFQRCEPWRAKRWRVFRERRRFCEAAA